MLLIGPMPGTGTAFHTPNWGALVWTRRARSKFRSFRRVAPTLHRRRHDFGRRALAVPGEEAL